MNKELEAALKKAYDKWSAQTLENEHNYEKGLITYAEYLEITLGFHKAAAFAMFEAVLAHRMNN